jgi:hypothetical protein
MSINRTHGYRGRARQWGAVKPRDTQSLALTMTSLIRTARAEARAAPPSGPVSGFSAPGPTVGQLLRIQEAFSNT